MEGAMIRVAALTSGKNMPSSRFRVRQHIEPLRKAGFDVREYTPAIDKYARFPGISQAESPKYIWPIYTLWQGVKLLTRVPGVMGSWKAQITWLERELLPGCLTLEPLLKRPYVFDVDDAIWLTHPFGRSTVIKIAKGAEVVLAGNAYIADWFSSHARDIRIVPTAIDTERFLPRRSSDIPNNKHFVIGWTGLSSNFTYIYEIERALEDFLKNHDAELLVIADQPPSFRRLRPEWVQYIKWSPAVEAQAVRQMDVGLMPLPNDDWSRGKCSFKMLQYMASGVPVVVSPVGMNAEILSMDKVGFPAKSEADWYDSLDQLYKDRDLGIKCGATGRFIVEQHFSRSVVSAKIAKVFKELA
ncbi:MAG: glycosyltransferase [Thermodesulfobacteriota bacterium]|nr:glycosyltransferase [Thermodesulfobacteriota bacterium]